MFRVLSALFLCLIAALMVSLPSGGQGKPHPRRMP